MTYESVEPFVNYVKNIPHGKESQKNTLNERTFFKDQVQCKNSLMKINPKVDSESQRRVQCSLSTVETVLESFPSCLISRTSESVLRGVRITESIKSESRKRNKKVSNE
jgi:hypothetical protein